jgi:hypothetical protein
MQNLFLIKNNNKRKEFIIWVRTRNK